MKILHKIFGLLLLSSLGASAKETDSKNAPLFTENKGQLTDQDHKLRPDISYYGQSDGLSYFFKANGISYQLHEKGKKENEYQVSRIDMTWLGANAGAKVVAQNTATGTDNFYNTQNSPVTGVHSFGDLKYEGIYQGIDLHYYYKNGSLKYDFIVAPGKDYKQIQIKVDGATAVTQNRDGSISVSTANGTFTEAMPVAYQNDKEIKTSWVLENNVLSFQLASYDPTLPLIIDPLVYQWTRNDSDNTTSASNPSNASFYRNVADAYGNIYVARNYTMPAYAFTSMMRVYKYSNSATAHIWNIAVYAPQISSGARIEGMTIYDTLFYISGSVNSISTLATTGAYQTTISGQQDGFLLKYDSAGNKIWGTYYGGTGDEIAGACKIDSAGYIYVCGTTTSTNNMAGAGAQQGSPAGLADAFIAKFSTGNGFRTWGTYFGGSGLDSAKSIEVRGNRLFIAGTTKSTSGIATTGAQQTAFIGNINGFLLCKDTSGVTQWSTYYGADTTLAERCVATATAVYLTGSTNTATGIATTGAYQAANAGEFDGFLAKFNYNGVRQWGTYYGGTGKDLAKGVAVGKEGRVFISGNTKSYTGIATTNSYNETYVPSAYTIGGVAMGSAYIAEIDTNGNRISGTYFNDGTIAEDCFVNTVGDVFISGTKTFITDDYIPFAAKFSFNNVGVPVLTASANSFCSNSSVLLSTPTVSGATYKWYRNNVLIPSATANTYTATLAGSYKVMLNDLPNATSLAVTLTVLPLPTTTIAKTDAPCTVATNGSITITPSGGTTPYSYVWDNSTNTTATRTGLTPGSYIVHTSDANTCTKTDTVTITNTNNSPSSTTSHTSVPCYGAPVATITVTTIAGTSPYAYTWDNLSATTPYLDGLAAGTYVVHTADANNCSDVDTIIVEQNTTMLPSDPLVSICAVTVDSVTGKNIVHWKKEGDVKATAYKIYRESTVAGEYDLLGTQDVNDDTWFADATSIPLQQSYSYKIAEVDSCDHEWDMSALHKTIHLSANVGVNGEINLSWNAYEGKPYSTHRIMRSFNGGPFTLLNEVSSTITSYSDLTPPIGTNVYRIQIDLGVVCDSVNTQYVISNKQSLSTTGIDELQGASQVQIVPNPTTGIINILGNIPAEIKLYDAVGRLMMEKQNVNKLDLGQFTKGMYMIRLIDKSGNVYHSQKVVLK
jgi:hypothetical protein